MDYETLKLGGIRCVSQYCPIISDFQSPSCLFMCPLGSFQIGRKTVSLFLRPAPLKGDISRIRKWESWREKTGRASLPGGQGFYSQHAHSASSLTTVFIPGPANTIPASPGSHSASAVINVLLADCQAESRNSSREGRHRVAKELPVTRRKVPGRIKFPLPHELSGNSHPRTMKGRKWQSAANSTRGPDGWTDESGRRFP